MRDTFSYRPLISIIVPVYDVQPASILTECIDSVLAQTYDNWQLCMTDDHSPMPEMAQIMHTHDDDSRFKLTYRSENGGIARATNDAIAQADGEYIAFLDCDDVLCPDALEEMVRRLNEDPSLDFIYSDEDKLTEDGTQYCYPFYKPDWSPDYFMNIMYTCHFSMYRRSIVTQIGGIPYGVDGAQDYAFTLHFTEMTTPDKIAHISRILYHWRLRTGSIAEDPEAKPYAQQAVVRAKTDALARRGLSGELEWIGDNFQYRVNYTWDRWPHVDVIIPSRDNPVVLRRCLESIRHKTSYPDYSITVMDNGSSEENRLEYQSICDSYSVRYVYEKMPFNFSASCNLGVEAVLGADWIRTYAAHQVVTDAQLIAHEAVVDTAHKRLLLFLNDDTEVLSAEWMGRMAGQALLPHAGAVGAKLLYPDSSLIQHVGIVSLESGPGHAYGRRDDREVFDYGINRSDYNPLAVTGACLMVDADKLARVGGWDERYPETYNDVDLCMKLTEAGYFNCLRNDAVLYHYESVSRGSDVMQAHKKYAMQQAWFLLYREHPEYCGSDPYYNVHYNQVSADYSVRPEALEDMRRGSDGSALAAAQKGEIPGFIRFAPSDRCIETKNLLWHIDRGLGGIGIVQSHEVMELTGWAHLCDAAAAYNRHYDRDGATAVCRGEQEHWVMLLKEGTPYGAFPVEAAARPDVSGIADSRDPRAGFHAAFRAAALDEGAYALAVCIRYEGAWYYAGCGESFIHYGPKGHYIENAAMLSEDQGSDDGTAESFGEEKSALTYNAPVIRIAVCCHKPSYVPDNPLLTPVQVGSALTGVRLEGMEHDDEGDNISVKNPHYCELTAHYWMWKNRSADYYGLFHYRRYLSFADALFPDDDEASIPACSLSGDTLAKYGLNEIRMRRIIPQYDVIVPEPFDVRNGDAVTNREHFIKDHSEKDLKHMVDAIRRLYPQYASAADAYLSGTMDYACNMFIMKRKYFEEYSAFLFDVLSDVEQKSDLTDYSAYNARLYGFLAERMLGIYVTWLKQQGGVRIHTLQRIHLAYTDAPTPDPKPAGGIPVICASDDGYAAYTAVMLRSVVMSMCASTSLDVIVLHDGMQEYHQEAIRHTVEYALRDCQTSGVADVSLEGPSTHAMESVSAVIPEANPKPHSAGTVTLRFYDYGYYREGVEAEDPGHYVYGGNVQLFLATLLPQYNRVIWLDSDLIVREDLTQLYETALQDNCMAGVRNMDVITLHNRYNEPLYASWKERASHAPGGKAREAQPDEFTEMRLKQWIQPGVMLYRLDACRHLVKDASIWDAMHIFGFGHEAEAVNILTEAPCMALPMKWNVLQQDNFAVMVGPREGAAAALNSEDTAAYRLAGRAWAIIHYSGREKPWYNHHLKADYLWWECARHTAAYETLLQNLCHETFPEIERMQKMQQKMQLKAAEEAPRPGAARRVVEAVKEHLPEETRQQIKQGLKKVLPKAAVEKLKKLR